MATISCPDCDRAISESAEACPGCGRPGRAKRYNYRFVQIPKNLLANDQTASTVAAEYLGKLTSEWSAAGWEFYRMDEVSATVPAGCLAAAFGQGNSHTVYGMVCFRRPV